jgi:hypothetical protein
MDWLANRDGIAHFMDRLAARCAGRLRAKMVVGGHSPPSADQAA